MVTLEKNFSWTPNAKGNEDKSASEQLMEFCNNLNAQGWRIKFTTPVGNGYVVHCETEKVPEFDEQVKS